MDKQKMDARIDNAAEQTKETMDTLSNMLDNATHCADATTTKVQNLVKESTMKASNRIKEGTIKATNRIEEAVTTVADRVREKAGK